MNKNHRTKNAVSEIGSIIELLSHTHEHLETGALDEIKNFIKQNQLPNGAFADRSGQADWYYSFFGYLLCCSLQMDDELKSLKAYVGKAPKPSTQSHIDTTIHALLKVALDRKFFYKLRKSIQLTRLLLFKNKTEVYDFFFVLLIFNYYWGWSKCIALQIDKRANALLSDVYSPCSHKAALLLIKVHANEPSVQLVSQIQEYLTDGGAFSAFPQHYNPDMLSTAVALYALLQAGADIRLFAPGCLVFVNTHFDRGAFLSGDGDQTQDMEYTFYGLLALNAIILNKNKTQTEKQ